MTSQNDDHDDDDDGSDDGDVDRDGHGWMMVKMTDDGYSMMDDG